MSALKMEGAERVRAAEAGLIDCSRASERTQGFYTLILLELGIPPNNWQFPF